MGRVWAEDAPRGGAAVVDVPDASRDETTVGAPEGWEDGLACGGGVDMGDARRDSGGMIRLG